MFKVHYPINTVTILLIAAVCFVLLNACGSRRTYVTQASVEGFATFPLIEIPDFKSSDPLIPQDLLWRVPNEIAEKLKKQNVFVGVSRSPLEISEGVLLMEGTVVEVSPVEWYKQIVNNGIVKVNIRIIEKENNKLIAEADFEGTAKWGLFGGGRVFADMRLIDEIASYIKSNYAK